MLSFSPTGLLSRRRTLTILFLALFILLVSAIRDPPPNWRWLYEWENNLPQHNVDLPFPEGKEGRFVVFKNDLALTGGVGWNNCLHEILMNTYLAYKANRSYVFPDYSWLPHHYPWRFHPRRNWELRTPINALIAGPSAGGPWSPPDPAPRAISDRFFDTVCPSHERRIINTRDIKPSILWSSGRVIFDTWLKALREAPERCIEIQPAIRKEDRDPQVFDLMFWGEGKAVELWDEFRDSPVSRLFATSPVAKAAVDRNEFALTPRTPIRDPLASNDLFDRMLAVHIRRGDFNRACKHFARWNSTFYSWNLLPFLPDKFQHPSGWDVDQQETIRHYEEHCAPTEEVMALKIHTSRQDYVRAGKENSTRGQVRYLDTVYILTDDQDGRAPWLEKLKTLLYEDGWSHVATTQNLELTQEQKDVSMAVDMDIARKAAVFVGNGWSSMTSNIVYRRLNEAILYRVSPISLFLYTTVPALDLDGLNDLGDKRRSVYTLHIRR